LSFRNQEVILKRGATDLEVLFLAEEHKPNAAAEIRSEEGP